VEFVPLASITSLCDSVNITDRSGYDNQPAPPILAVRVDGTSMIVIGESG